MAHDFEGGGAVEPVFEGKGTLVEEEGEARLQWDFACIEGSGRQRR